MTFKDNDEFISVRELAKLIYASDISVYQLIREGNLKTGIFTTNGTILVSKSAVPKIKQELDCPKIFTLMITILPKI